MISFWKTFLIALLVLILCTVAPANAADTITVPDDYLTIQQAIDNATADDTIVVSAGIYNEHILVDKRLTISGTEMPVIDGELKFGVNTVTLTASGINFTGITIIGGGSNAAGIAVTADNVEVRDCYVHDNKGYGIELSSVSDVVIRDNNISNNFGPGSTGIRLDASNGNFVYNNILRNNNVFGLELEASSSNVIEKNTVQTSGSYGVSIETRSNLNRFLENVVEETESEHGIRIYSSDSNLFQENTIRNNGDDNSGHVGIYADTIYNTTFEHNSFTGNKGTGMDLTDCYDSVFANNTILSNNEYGINCYDCDDNTFTNNTIRNNAALYAEPGLCLYSSGGNTVVNNTIKDNGNDGIYLEYSHSNTLFGNIIRENSNRGLFLKNSRYNELYENNITGNLYNFGITIGGTINYFGNTVGESNLVDGKPIVYLIGAENSVVNESSNAATVYCIDCDNITVENLTLTNNSYGIVFYNTINSNIQENHVSSCEDGIFLMDSDGNVVKSNNASYNSQYGISERSSTGNFIYLNNFIGNEDADYYSDSSVTTWRSPVELLYFFGGNQYNGYLGNYWGSYTGSDGNGDGIGDTAFTISGETNNDDYPLIKTKEFFTFTPNQPPSADFMYSPLSPDTDDTIVFSDASIDLDGTIGSWAWDFGDGGTSALQNPTHQYALPGFYKVNLTVTDNNLDTGSTAKSLFVHAAGSMTIYVPDNFSTIQDAINAARDGDTVLVRSGTYPENVLVNKSVAVTGEGLPVVDATGGTGFTVESPACAIDSFAITGSTEWESGGIKVESDGNTIKNNVLSGNCYGIYLSAADNNILFNNICNDSVEHGIYLSSSMNNTIYNNTCANNSALGGGEGGHGYGICLSSSGGNVLYFNDLDNVDLTTPGLFYNAYDSNTTTPLNTWYNATLQLGNRYSDYYGTDGNRDGVGDQPYEIAHSGGEETLPNFDLYPLMPLGPRPVYAPIVGGVQVADLTAASININWDIENEIPCDNRVLYGTAPSLAGALWSGWDNATTEPGIELSGLLSNTTYYYSCYSYNSENSSLFDNSSVRSFTTLLRPNMIITVDDDNSDIPTPPADYESLSAALEASLDGDTILVYSGNYEGNYIIDKSLNITGIGRPVLVGEEYDTRDDSGGVVDFKATGCILQGFKIRGTRTSTCIRISPFSRDNIIRDNIIDGGTISDGRADYGLYVSAPGGNEFSNNLINGTKEGIFCDSTTSNTFADNELTDVSHYGIKLETSTNNVVQNNTLTDSLDNLGIELDGASYNIISNNTLRGNNLINVMGDRNLLENNRVEGPQEYHFAGIHITSGEANTLLNNTVTFQKFGILLTPHAETVTMRNNTMEDNTYNFGFTGDWAFAPTSPPGHSIDTSNTVDGDPVYYIIGEQDRELSYLTLSPAPGYLACIDCINITVRDFYLDNNCQGIFLYNSTDTLVDGITAHSNGEYGVLAYECDRLTLKNSNIDSNGMSSTGEDYAGVYLEESPGCSFLNNIITGNARLGIKLWYTCPDALIANSEITNNGDPTEPGSGTGIYISGSDAENITVHSNIIANTHAELQGTGIKNWAKNSTIYNNYFNNTKPSDVFSAASGTIWNITPTPGTNVIGGPWTAGNYWEDYEGIDSDGDGLGDTLVPYTADGGIIHEAGDYHPLLDTFVPDSIPPVLYIINPIEGEEYIPQQVSLKTFSPDPDAAFWWYSLNGAENVSFDSDAILRDLPLGENTLTVYLNDTSGNVNSSVVNFTVAEDQTAPEIHIVSPENGFEYNTSRDVPLKVWSPDEDVFSWWCSIDGESNTSFTPNATLAGLANGVHTLVVYADDVVGNTNSSQVTFTVNVNEEENPPSGGGGSGTGGAVIINPGEESSEEEEEEEEELLGDYLIILTPEEGRTVSRAGELRYACTVPLARAYYSLDEGTEKEVEPLAPVPVDRLKLGEHIFRVTGVDYEGKRYHASAKFEVIPLALGEKPDVGTPEYPDEAVYAFNGRAANYTLTFEASGLEDGELGVYINRYLSVNENENSNEIGNPVPLLSLHESGGLLGTLNGSEGAWQAYGYTIPANRIVPEAENFLSFIHQSNPGTASGSDSWHVRNVALVPEMPLSYPRIRVFTPDRALSPEDEMMVWVDISGIGEAGGSSDGSYSGSGADDYEASVYVVGPDGTVLSFPEGETTPEPLAQSYLEENHYGRIPGAMAFDENFLPGTYTLVGILSSLESGKPMSVSSEVVYYSDQPSVKLFLNRNSFYPGMPLTIEAVLTEGKTPESVSVLTRLERPEGADLFLPEKTGAFSMLHYAPLEDRYMTLYNEPVNGNWENGTYAVKCSLFNESGYELASDVLSFEVGTAESELSVRFDMPEDTLFPVVKSNIRLIDAASFGMLAEKSTTGPQPSVELQVPPGTYWIAGEIYTENGDVYRIPVSESNRVELGCGEKRTKSVSVSRISFVDFVNMLNEEVEA